jgi:hypothetical protein
VLGTDASSAATQTGGSDSVAERDGGGEPSAPVDGSSTGGTDIDAGTETSTGGVTSTGGATSSGDGAETRTGGVTSTGGVTGTGGATSSGGAETRTGGDSGTGGGGDVQACSSTATVGLEVGNLIPDVQVQRCDGSWVHLRELICGNVITQIYSYAAWCPGCRGFSGLEEDFPLTGNDLYDSYHDDGFEQVIVLSATEDHRQQNPTAEDCAELQKLHEGLVVFDATSSKMVDELGLQINGGTGLLDEQGLWVVAPPGEDVEGGGIGDVMKELMSRFSPFGR